MQGSVVQKKGRWYPITRHRQPDGTYKQRSHGGFATKREAQMILNEAINRMNKGVYVEPTKITVRQYLAEWLPEFERTVRPSTFESYANNIDWHVLPALGEQRLQALTAAQLNDLYGQLLGAGRKDGNGGLAPKTVRYVHGIIRKALADAVDAGLLVQNVATRAKPPKPKAAKAKEMQTWNAEQLRAFLNHVSQDRLFALWRLAASTGMRRGELAGLRWDSVDLDAARVSITQTLVSVGYRVVPGDAKTQKGVRVVDLDDVTVAALRRHRTAQLQEQLAWGPAYAGSGHVFTREDGSLVHPQRISQMFKALARAAELPVIRFHDLRHTHATLALRAGVPVKIISERLGHADVAFTMNTYAHAMPGMQAEAAALVAALVDG